jgi:acyl-CoA synthetase (NDP forming)
MNKNEALDAVFNLRSVAIVGVAPGDEGFNTGRLFLNHIIEYGFKGRIYLVNPKGGDVLGLKIYPHLQDIPEPVDYIISCIPAPFVAQLIKDSAAKGAKAVCLFTSGFSEFGTESGRQMEREVQRLAQSTGVRVIGPNCLGIHSPKASFSFAPDLPHETGPVSFICQSGGNTMYLVRAAAARGIRFSKVISYGNACDIDETDLLEYLHRDAETKVVAAYIEGVKDGRRFYRALQELAAVKPVVVLKGGTTGAGARVAASHTAALAVSRDVWMSVLDQAGAIRVDSLDEMADMLVTLQYMPILGGMWVARAGVGGGAGVLATDDWDREGFSLPELPEQVRQAFRDALGNDAGTILSNPVDIPHLGFGHQAFRDALTKLSEFQGIDLLVFHLPIRGIMLSLAIAPILIDRETETIIRLHRESAKPMAVVAHYMATGEGWHFAAKYVKDFYEAGLPVYHSIASAAKAIDRFVRYHRNRTASPQ